MVALLCYVAIGIAIISVIQIFLLKKVIYLYFILVKDQKILINKIIFYSFCQLSLIIKKIPFHPFRLISKKNEWQRIHCFSSEAASKFSRASLNFLRNFLLCIALVIELVLKYEEFEFNPTLAVMLQNVFIRFLSALIFFKSCSAFQQPFPVFGLMKNLFLCI